jgi:hypothetical protein
MGVGGRKNALDLQSTTTNIFSCKNEFQIIPLGNIINNSVGLYGVEWNI